MKTLIIIPAFNESENIEKVVKSLMDNYPQGDYVVINDCSTDTTADILDRHNINHIDLCCNLGIGGAVQSGYIYAKEKGYDCAVQMDGDGQHDSSYIPKLIENIENGKANIVIGSRFIKKEGFQSSGMRRFGIKFLSSIIKLVSGASVKDVTSGFRAVDKNYIDFYSKNYASDYPEPEAIVAAKLSGAKIAEVPVIMKERTGGVSSISPFKSVYYMIKVSIAILFAGFILKKGENK